MWHEKLLDENVRMKLRYGLVNLLAVLLWASCSMALALEYRVEIIAPPAIKKLLEQNLDLVRWRGNERLDEAQWWQVYQALPEQVGALVATEGYFSPKVSATLDQTGREWLVRLELEPGQAAQVGKVALQLPGFASEEQALLRADWPLREGMVFRQDEWETAKRRLLRQASKRRYPLAQLSQSRADVDLETGRVDLTVTLQSGPQVEFGAVRIEGLQRYPASVIHNLNRIRPGQVVDEAALLEFQARLQDTRYFKSVAVSADLPADSQTPVAVNGGVVKAELANGDATKADAPNAAAGPGLLRVPVLVSVLEQQRKKIDLGLGYSTNTGNRLQAAFHDLNASKLYPGLQFSSALVLETRKQNVHADWALPAASNGDNDSVSSAWERIDLNGEVTRTLILAAKRSWGNSAINRSLILEFQNERKTVNGVEGGVASRKSSSNSLPLSFHFTRRQFDNVLFPTRGNALHVQIGGTPLRLVSDEPFFRTSLKYLQYWPLTSHANLVTRVELGGLFSRHKSGIPNSYLFRAGGDQSVRGYGLAQLGEVDGAAIVGARYLAAASAEYQHWLSGRQWGGALFYDAGNARDTLKDLRLKAGYGAGLRWRSPVG
ncbi:MAG: hypothetical protein RL748_2391, partial [Pseudomonadota bacterium]